MSAVARILAIEDDPVLGEHLHEHLRQRGYEVTLSSEGDAGLELARDRPFDLILLDILLPGRNGLDVLAELRRDPAVLRHLHGGGALGLRNPQCAARLGRVAAGRAAGAGRLLAATAGAFPMTAKAKSLTQSMSWLHTWSGLLLGWVLFAIFLTGTLAVFDKEIDNWMRPETPAHSVDQRQALGTALSYLRRAHAAESSWNIGLPTERSPQLSVSVGEQRRGGGAAALACA